MIRAAHQRQQGTNMVYEIEQEDQDQNPTPLEYVKWAVEQDNIVTDIEDDVLQKMSGQVIEDYNTDKDSMSDWLKKMEKGLDLAKMVKGEKTYPHDMAANIKYPLITTAALNYNARTYPAIVPSGNPVLGKVNGKDPEGVKAAKADRSTNYVSHQLREEISSWEEDMDRMTFVGPIVGTMFKKVWFDPSLNVPRSRLCQPGKVIVNHSITHLDNAPAITEEMELLPHEVETRLRSGLWSDDSDKMEIPDDEQSKAIDFLEQHMRFDLDDDGYAEPYIVTMHKDSRAIVRVVANFEFEDVMLSPDNSQILTVKPSTFFVPYHFMPSFDGGFFGDGLGMLLSDTSETINSTLNMLMDAGHYQAMPTGWVGSQSLRIKGGTQRFKPGEWRNINATGNDIRSGMVQMSMPAPSPVLFQMLGLMIDMGREIGSSKDIPPEQASQMTATTTMALVDQGERVFNASYKRIYRALTKEFKLLFKLNAAMLDPQKYNAYFDDDETYSPQDDFDLRGMDITPVADPKAVTNTQKAARAQFLMEMAQGGLIDQGEAMTRVLEAMSIDDVEELVPQAGPQDQMVQEMQMLNARLDLQAKAAKIDLDMANTIKAIAAAEGEEEGRQLNEYLNAITIMKEELELGQRRLEGVTNGPGNGLPAGPDAPPPQ